MTNSYPTERFAPLDSALERQLPQLAKKIVALWGTREFETFVSHTLMDSRDGARQGLPWDAAQDLFFLLHLSVAKRALIAAQATEQPFKLVFKTMMTNMEAETLKQTAQDWVTPLANPETGRAQARTDGRSAPGTARKSKKPGFFASLFGG